MQGELLLLCSDGLYDLVDDKEICNLLGSEIYKSADDLIALANERGAHDNITVAIAGYL